MSCNDTSTDSTRAPSGWRHPVLRLFALVAIIAAPLAVALQSRPSDAPPETRGNTLEVRFVAPDGVRLPEPSTVVLHTRRGADPLEFDIERRTPLETDRVTFRDVTPGVKRVQLLDETGRTLVLHKMSVDRPEMTAEIALAPLRLHGRVTTSGEPAPNVQIEFVDPCHPAVVLASAQADAAGRYETTIWQRGEIVGYAFDEKPVSCSMFAQLNIGADAREHEFDLKMATAGLTLRVVDAASDRPIPRAEVDRWVRNVDDDVVHAGKAMTDDEGQYRLSRHQAGSATFIVKAPGYRLAEVQEELREGERSEVRVALLAAIGTGGRVYGADGAPLDGAVVMGGYPGERTTGPVLRAGTNTEGEFRFSSDPDANTPFYVIARGHALAVTTLRASDDNVIQLEPMGGDGSVSVVTTDDTADARPLPARRLRVAPAGRAIVPDHVLADLAALNGMTLIEIIRTDSQGRSPLPRYLGRGRWDVYIRAERSADVQPIGSIRMPLRGSQVFAAGR